jgi:hypothetical protein
LLIDVFEKGGTDNFLEGGLVNTKDDDHHLKSGGVSAEEPFLGAKLRIGNGDHAPVSFGGYQGFDVADYPALLYHRFRHGFHLCFHDPQGLVIGFRQGVAEDADKGFFVPGNAYALAPAVFMVFVMVIMIMMVFMVMIMVVIMMMVFMIVGV